VGGRRRLIAAIGLVIAAPLIFAAAGATPRPGESGGGIHGGGLIVGVILVVVGIGAGLIGARRADD
jgi:hypothetical protein